MRTVQRECVSIVVAYLLELRNKGKFVSARRVQGPERVEPGLVNIRGEIGRGTFLKDPSLSFNFSLILISSFDFTVYLAKRLVFSCP